MGLFRLVLALLVACSHLPQTGGSIWWTKSGAVFAVKAFFILSGFYMALVLDARYRDKPVRHFYASRALRLLPAYWFVSAATLVAVLVLTGRSVTFYHLLDPVMAWSYVTPLAMPASVLAYLAVSLTTLVGADSWLWLGFNTTTGAWSVAPAYADGATSALALSFVPQAWTLGVEILFYLLVPFLFLRRMWVLLLVVVASLAFRGVLASYGFAGEPWSRALLPSELVYFVGGIIAYRGYLTLQTRRVPAAVSWAALFVMLALELSVSPYVLIHSHTLFISTVPYLLLVMLIPFSFAATRGFRFDAFLGNLAYPVYLVHLLTFGIVDKTALKAAFVALFGSGWGWLMANLALVLLAAWIVELVAVRPVDRLRIRFGARGRQLVAGQALAPVGA